MITDAFRLDGKVALITGASKGIGAGIATAFGEMGANIALVARSEEELQAVAGAVEALGVEALPLACDITSDTDINMALEQLRSRFGRLDILINNAGGPGKGYGSLEDVDRARFDHTLNINLSSAYSLTHLALPLLKAADSATIVNISSALAWMVDKHFAAYGAAKAGMEQMTRILAYELAPDIRVNAVAPGWIASSGMDNYPAHMKSWIRSLADAVPIKRMGTESEVSSAICFLLSPGAAFISGDCLRIDGAASQGGRVWPMPKAQNNEPYNGFHRAVTPKVLSDD